MKFEQHWPDGFREVICNPQLFSHTNAQGSKLDLALQRSKVNVRPSLATFVDFPCPMISAKIQPQDIHGSGEEFKSFF